MYIFNILKVYIISSEKTIASIFEKIYKKQINLQIRIDLYSNNYINYRYYYIDNFFYWYKEVPSLIANTSDTNAKIRATKI